MKLIVIGNAQHGKDTVCEMLNKEFGLTFESSSCFCANRAVRPYLAAKGIVYETDEELYADRVNHRADWYNAITEYNTPDKARLVKELFERYDIYCGLRNREELLEARRQGIVDFIIWVDASERMPAEDSSSITVAAADADYVIHNNDDLNHLRYEIIDAHTAAMIHMGEIK